MITVRFTARKLLVFVLLFATAAALLLVVDSANAQGPQGGGRAPAAVAGNAFTYQGQLKSGGALVNTNCDFQFGLWDGASAGPQYGATQTVSSLPVSNGLFTTQLDFGNVFTGTARYMQSAVRCPAGGGSYTNLNPRQALTPAPIALSLPGLYTTQNITSPNLIGGYSGNTVSNTVVGGAIGGGGTSVAPNRVWADYAIVGGGASNIASGYAAAIGGGTNNTASANYTSIDGGLGNTAAGFRATIGAGSLNTASGADAVIGGGYANIANNQYATVGGGYGNTASGDRSSIGGGASNTASGSWSTIAGGLQNSANISYTTIGGGYFNTASGFRTAIGGGAFNTASAASATIGGGYQNTASNFYSTVPGGWNASASHFGEMAFASGGFVNSGDAQTSVYVLRTATSTNTPTELFLAGYGERITIAVSRTLTFDILVVAREDDSNESAGYHIRGVIKNDGGTTALVGSLLKDVLGENAAAWDVTVTADNTNDALKIEATGETVKNIRWVATVRTVEVAWP